MERTARLHSSLRNCTTVSSPIKIPQRGASCDRSESKMVARHLIGQQIAFEEKMGQFSLCVIICGFEKINVAKSDSCSSCTAIFISFISEIDIHKSIIDNKALDDENIR